MGSAGGLRGPWRCGPHVCPSRRPPHPPVTFLSGASTALSTHNNSVFGDLKADELELLYSAYGDETGVQCALRWVGCLASVAGCRPCLCSVK